MTKEEKFKAMVQEAKKANENFREDNTDLALIWASERIAQLEALTPSEKIHADALSDFYGLVEAKEKIATQAAQIEMLRDVLTQLNLQAEFQSSDYAISVHRLSLQALSTTPAQALEAFAAKVREQCAKACNETIASIEGELCAEAIRSLKELP